MLNFTREIVKSGAKNKTVDLTVEGFDEKSKTRRISIIKGLDELIAAKAGQQEILRLTSLFEADAENGFGELIDSDDAVVA